FVAIALIQPVLKQLREANAAAPPFAPSSGEKQFQSLFDNQVARQIAGATHFPVVDRIAHDLLKRGRTIPTAQIDYGKQVRLSASPAAQPSAGTASATHEATNAPRQSPDPDLTSRAHPRPEP